MIIIGGAAIGPIAESVETDIMIVGRPRLPGQIGQKTTPEVEGTIDTGREHEHRLLHKARRNFLIVTDEFAAQLAMRTMPQSAIHEMRCRRKDETFSLIVEETPGAIRAEALKTETAESSGEGQMMKPARRV